MTHNELVEYLKTRGAPEWMLECARAGTYDPPKQDGWLQRPCDPLSVDAKKAGIEV